MINHITTRKMVRALLCAKILFILTSFFNILIKFYWRIRYMIYYFYRFSKVFNVSAFYQKNHIFNIDFFLYLSYHRYNHWLSVNFIENKFF